MKKLLLAALLFLFSVPAIGQVRQSGTVTAGHVTCWTTSGVIQDCGSAANGIATSFGVTNNGGEGICLNSAASTAVGYQRLCFSATTDAPAKIILQNFGTATAQNLDFVINGVTVTLPTGGGSFVTATGPFVSGHAACWSGTSGLLIDCTVAITAGTQFGVPIYSTSSTIIGTAALTAGQILVGQSSAVPLPKTMSGDATLAASGAITVAANAVTNAKLATTAAYTIKGNTSASTAVPTDFAPSDLTQKVSPASGDWIIIQDITASNQLKKATVSSIAAGSTVASYNARTGAVTPQGDDYSSLLGLVIPNCTLAATVGSNNLTVALKDQAGSDPSATSPCSIPYRSATATTGTLTTRTVTAATSVVINAGSTLGTSNTTGFIIWVTAVDTGSTTVLGLSVQSDATRIYPLLEDTLVSTTACSACITATAAGTVYTTAAQTSRPFRILGELIWENGLTTAGTYASGPTTIQLFGPGIKKPGDVLSQYFNSTPTRTQQTANAYASTTITQAISPQSKTSKILIQVSGDTQVSASLNSGTISLCRGASACATTVLLTQNPLNQNASQIVGFNHFLYFDALNSTATTTYIVQIKGDGTNLVGFPQNSATWLIQELKG